MYSHNSANNPNGKRRTKTALRKAEVLELRKAGWSYQAIGDKLGISDVAAYKLAIAALDEVRTRTKEEAAALLEIELQRLDDQQKTALAIMESETEKEGLRLAAIDRLLKISERRAKLLGLDAPDKHDVNTNSVIRVTIQGEE